LYRGKGGRQGDCGRGTLKPENFRQKVGGKTVGDFVGAGGPKSIASKGGGKRGSGANKGDYSLSFPNFFWQITRGKREKKGGGEVRRHKGQTVNRLKKKEEGK